MLTIDLSITDIHAFNKMMSILVKYESQLPPMMIEELEALALDMGA